MNDQLQYLSRLKKDLQPDQGIFQAFQDLWSLCKERNLTPTHILLGTNAYEKFKNESALYRYLNPIGDQDAENEGLIGYLIDIPVLVGKDLGDDGFCYNPEILQNDQAQLTAFAKKSKWTINADGIVFNIGDNIIGTF